MSQNSAIDSYALAVAIINQLHDSGVDRIILTPGFRNSPLILAANRSKKMKAITVLDERGAGFLALGICKSSRRPVAVACTSGTAVANLFPAVMEANHSNLPLIIITADRPEELIGTGANQCTDQRAIFGVHVRHYENLEPPTFNGFEENARYVISRSIASAVSEKAGPIHINVRFREPFLASLSEVEEFDRDYSPKMGYQSFSAAGGPSREQFEAFQSLFAAAERPLLVVGPSEFAEATRKKILAVAKRLGAPLLAEPSSGLAFGLESGLLVHRAEQVIDEMVKKIEAADLVIRIGAPLTGRHLGIFLKEKKPVQIVFDPSGEAREPHLYPSVFFMGGFEGWLEALQRFDFFLSRIDTKWRDSVIHADSLIDSALSKHMTKFSAFTEWSFFRNFKPKNKVQVFLGNSMPIRDFNSVVKRDLNLAGVFSNRGQSGIDGLLASACGVALGGQIETHAMIGDLSTLHDLSSLSIMSKLRDQISLTLWVLNNGGGEIFRTLATAKASDQEEWFTTPQKFQLSALAKAFDLPFTQVRSKEDLLELNDLSYLGVRVIEVLVDGPANLEIRKTFSP